MNICFEVLGFNQVEAYEPTDLGELGACCHTEDEFDRVTGLFRTALLHYGLDLNGLVDASHLASIDHYLRRVDELSSGWLSLARRALELVSKSGSSCNVIVSAGSLLPTMAKCCVFGLAPFVPADFIYSSRISNKTELFRRVVNRFRDGKPHTSFSLPTSRERLVAGFSFRQRPHSTDATHAASTLCLTLPDIKEGTSTGALTESRSLPIASPPPPQRRRNSVPLLESSLAGLGIYLDDSEEEASVALPPQVVVVGDGVEECRAAIQVCTVPM